MDAAVDSVLDVDPARLSHDQKLDLLEAIEHTRSALDAQTHLTLHLLSREGDAEHRAKEWVREEIAAVLHLAPGTAAAKMHDATALVTRLPRTLDLLVDGTLTLMHARALIDAVTHLDDQTATAIETRVLPVDDNDIPTVGRFRQQVQRAVLAEEPRTAEQKHRDAEAERRVVLYPADDGMATVWAYLRADAAMALMTGIDAYASALDDADDTRTTDQKRADVLTDLADRALADTTTTWQGRKPAVQVSLALSTLLGHDEQPGELDGYGPISASLARDIAFDPSGTWRRLLTDDTGRLLDYGTSVYRPPADLREHVIARDQTCTFPGCVRHARRNELDHIQPHSAGGATSEANMHPPCTRHHHLKHDAGWTISKTSAATTWRTPTGREFQTPTATYPIDTTVRIAPDPPPF